MYTVENPGEGLPEVFAKIPRGSKLAGKTVSGAPFFGFYCLKVPFWYLFDSSVFVHTFEHSNLPPFCFLAQIPILYSKHLVQLNVKLSFACFIPPHPLLFASTYAMSFSQIDALSLKK
jgi:hypothetical protein